MRAISINILSKHYSKLFILPVTRSALATFSPNLFEHSKPKKTIVIIAKIS